TSLQSPLMQAMSPDPARSQPSPSGTEPTPAQTFCPLKFETSYWIVHNGVSPSQSVSAPHSEQVSAVMMPATSSTSSHCRPSWQTSLVSQPPPSSPELQVEPVEASGLGIEQPPSAQSASSVHSPQRPPSTGTWKHFSVSHSQSSTHEPPSGTSIMQVTPVVESLVLEVSAVVSPSVES